MFKKYYRFRVAVVIFLTAALMFGLVAAPAASADNTYVYDTAWHRDNSDTKVASNTSENTERILTVYYVKGWGDDAYLVREQHPTTHKILSWFSVYELIKGEPYTPGARKVLNPWTNVRSIYTVQGRTTVDFDARILKPGLSKHVRELGLQSIVNTLTELDGIEKVRFTVNGRQYGDLYKYRERDLSMVRDGSEKPQPEPQPELKVYLNDNQWVWSPLNVSGRISDFNGLVVAKLKTKQGALAVGYAWIGKNSNGRFSIDLPYETPDVWWGKVEITTFYADDWTQGPGQTIPVRFVHW
ncbi:MAG: GerMN domain-containing protein [Peptococcaceae bacterium]|nr:GerMN domain-containing protein [Peptococcaceae bacterium]